MSRDVCFFSKLWTCNTKDVVLPVLHHYALFKNLTSLSYLYINNCINPHNHKSRYERDQDLNVRVKTKKTQNILSREDRPFFNAFSIKLGNLYIFINFPQIWRGFLDDCFYIHILIKILYSGLFMVNKKTISNLFFPTKYAW